MSSFLRSTLLKFPIRELPGVLEKVDYFAHRVRKWQSKLMEKKDDIIQFVIEYCEKRKISQEVAEKLDLLLATSRQSSHRWQVYELHKNYREHDVELNPDLVIKNIARKLQFGFRLNCQHVLDNGALWMRICLQNLFTNAYTVMFGVHYIRSATFIATFPVGDDKTRILNAVATALYYEECHEIALTGGCVRSLMQLYCERGNSGFRIQHVNGHPLKQIQTPRDQSSTEQTASSNYSDEDDKTNRDKYVEEIFGNSCQPEIPFLTFEVNSKFRGTPRLMPKTSRFECKVTFEGDSVLDGFCELISAGIASPPLPKFLQDARMNGVNSIKLSSKR